MTFGKLVRRGLTYYRGGHLRVLLGCAVGTAVLVGALVVGDSVRHSLRRIVFDRLGRVELALTVGDRFFRTELASELAGTLDAVVAPVLQSRGIASSEGGALRVNTVQVLGVDARFGELGGAAEVYAGLAADEAVINRGLAGRLGLTVGDEFVLRVEDLDAMPRDAPLALDRNASLARRLTIRAVASEAEFGRFDLRAEQTAPFSAFLSLEALAEWMGLAGRANTLLAAGRGPDPLALPDVEAALRRFWSPADAGLQVVGGTVGGGSEIRSDRIFLDDAVVDAARGLGQPSRPVLTYFVNELRFRELSTPYSFVTGAGPPLVPDDLTDDEIVVNAWLARDLGAGVGDRIELAFYILGPGRTLVEDRSVFTVKAVVPLSGIHADRGLLPDFPGLAEIESTRDWRPDVPVDLDRIRDKDEAYWEEHRGTPKAFVTLAAARRIWANRFGGATAVRFPGLDAGRLRDDLIRALDPAALGFVFHDVRAAGLRAGAQSVDFGQLFLGLSFFVIAAALLLTGLLFVFNLETRSRETGLLLALGFPRRLVRRLLLTEGAGLALIGGFLGSGLGLLFNLGVLAALKTVWRGAVGTSALRMYAAPMTVALGTALGVAAALIALWWVSRRMMRRPASGLQSGLTRLPGPRRKGRRISLGIGVLSLLGAAVLLATAEFDRGREAFAVFFAAGSLLLAGGMAWVHVLLTAAGRGRGRGRLSLAGVGIRGAARRRMRSLTLIGLLATGLFIVFTVGANRRSTLLDAERRDSGTGGFALFGRSAIPVFHDLNSPEGRRRYGLEGLGDPALRFVPFRVKDGDDASCLNLNRVSTPRLLGAAAGELSSRKAFRFIDRTGEVDPANPWAALDRPLPDGAVPAVADNTVIIWGLGKKVGDTLTFRDESGAEFTARLVGGLANSIFQGHVIISEKIFLEKYPSLSGHRLFLVDASPGTLERVGAGISRAMQDQGLDLVRASDRLAEFNQVENTYLSIFLILGSFGLILGCVGIGIVVWRNIREREGELALLRAVGFGRRSIRALILYEHLALMAAGILLGLFAALLATLPSMLAPGSGVPYGTILLVLVVVALNGGFWTWAAASRALRADLLPALRKE